MLHGVALRGGNIEFLASRFETSRTGIRLHGQRSARKDSLPQEMPTKFSQLIFPILVRSAAKRQLGTGGMLYRALAFDKIAPNGYSMPTY
jgi:hypothetical protein